MRAARVKILFLAGLMFFSSIGLTRAVAADETAAPRPETASPLETASPPETGSRPKIGLALGGGGAMGFTHLGVLKWLEENRIPVDYIAGTSMGGLIGGAYAMGMSPAEIEMFIKRLNWERLFDQSPPFNALDFRRKEDQLNYPIEIGLRDLIFIPNGMSAYRVDLLLSRLTLPYSTIRDFDELPIPYRCVATDLVNSRKVVLRDGALSEALRATMSVPGAFTPVESEGRVLVDGCLVDNVPADVSREMGAEINIAVNCIQDNSGLDSRRLNSVLLGAINTVLIDNSNRFLELADCVIRPRFGKLSYIDWTAVDQFMAAGYQAAAEQADVLRKYQVNEHTWREYLNLRFLRKRTQVPVPVEIEILGAGKINQDTIRAKLASFTGRPVDPVALEAALTEIMGMGFYESVRYKVVVRDQLPTLRIVVKEKLYGPPFIGFIFQFKFVDEQVDLNLRARMTSLDITGAGSELRSDFSLGTDPSLRCELYQPISKSGWFVAPRLTLDRINQSLFEQEARITDFQVNYGSLGFDVGYHFDKFSELRAGYQVGYQRVDTTVGPPLPEMSGLVRKFDYTWSYRKVNYEIFTDGAFYCDLKGNWYEEAPNATEPFGTTEESIKWAIPVDDQNILVMSLAAGATLKGRLPVLQQFTLGGPFRLGAYHQDELRGENYCLGTFGLLKDLGKPLGLNHLYLAAFLENGGVFADWADTEWTANLSAGIQSPTVYGSFYLGASLIPERPVRVNCLFGRIF